MKAGRAVDFNMPTHGDCLTAALPIQIREGERCWIGAMAGEKALLPVGAGDPVANVP